MVVGEPQILGQLKAAYRAAQAAGTVGPILNRLLQHSFAVAKQIRTTTAIGENPVSVAFAAVRLARQILGELSERTALLIGAGETIELVARHLVESGIGRLIVANRTFARSRALAERFSAYAAPFDAIASHLAEVDIVISATASPHPIITQAIMASALRARKHRPVFLLDIAVPRDIETSVGELPDAYLYTVDDLKVVIEDNRRSRQVAAQQAEEIIAEQVAAFMRWKNSLDAVPAILDLRKRAERDRDELLIKAQRQLRRGEDPEEVVRRLADSLVKRLTHRPSVKLKEAAAQQSTELLDAARELLDLPPPGDV
jgi:glutamyl-tRNA reductase